MTTGYELMPSDVDFTRFMVRMARHPLGALMREAPGSHLTDAEIAEAHREQRSNSRHRTELDRRHRAARAAESARIAAFTKRQIEMGERLLGLTKEEDAA